MRVPKLKTVIRRRLLVNFRVDPAVMCRALPHGMEPKVQAGHAVAGICLIRLEHVRPAVTARVPLGFSSENAAHRVAVQWVDEGEQREGVYILRRDSDSRVNQLVGGRLFPGQHHLARFEIEDDGERVNLAMRSTDGTVRVEVRGRTATALPARSVFATPDAASGFFAAGSLGYSETRNPARFDGMHLEVPRWAVSPLAVEHVDSSWFADPTVFPPGSAEFDHALVMRDLEATWIAAPDYRVQAATSG